MANPIPRSLTVLVVDDEALLRWSLAEMLRRGGHIVVEASSAREALDAITREPWAFDVILLDFLLPDSADLQLLAEVRRRVPRSAVVLMSVHGSPELEQGALDLGACCVLNKPFDMHDVERLVADACRASRIH